VLDDRSLVATADGGTALCGPTTSVGPGAPNPNFLLLKLTPVGGIQWASSHPSQNYPGLASDVPYPLIQDATGGYAAAGWTNSFSFLGKDDFHFATFDRNGNRVICTDSQLPIRDSFLVDGGQIRDTMCTVEWDSLPLESVAVGYHAICDTWLGVGELQPGRAASPKGALLSSGGLVSLVLPQAADVDLRIYAVDGRRLAVLARGYLAAGAHRFPLPASGAPGVYVVNGKVGGAPVAVKVLKL
jgi:hypothetical protein